MAIYDKDQITLVNEDGIPEELKSRRQWVLWRAIYNNETSKFDKLPFQIDGSPASSTDLATWNDFETILQIYNEGDSKGNQYDGIGFVLSSLDPYLVVDIDDIEDVDNLDELASEITSMSFAELSPSKKGVHVWFKAKHKKERHKNKDAKTGYEVYETSRYMTVTGESVNNLPINNGNLQLDTFLDKVLKRENHINPQINNGQTGKAALPEGEIIKCALAGKNSERFMKFMFGGWEQSYSSQSEADMAFANDLAFWCNRDFQMCDSIFRKSSLMREKFDRQQNGVTYGIELLTKAIEECEKTFTLEEKPRKQFDWFMKNANGTTSFLHHVLGKTVLAQYHIKRFPDAHGDLYFFHPKKGVYEIDASGRLVKGIIRGYDETLKASQINEVYRFIEEMCPVEKEINTNYVAVRNGLINFTSKQLEPFNPNVFVTQKFPTNYIPNAYDSFVDNTLKKVTEGFEPSIENLKEMFACVLYPKILVPKMFYLYGKSAANGKSSVLNMIQQTFNKDGGNISSVSPHKLATNNFASASMYGKACNITDDNPDFVIQDSGELKSIISGGYIQIERKGRDPFSVRMATTLIVASNHLPGFDEHGNAISRRLWIIEFNHNFSKDKECLSDLETQERISSQSAREYVMKLAVEKLFEMLDNPNANKLTENEKCESILGTFEKQNDVWADYFSEYDIDYFNEYSGERVIQDYQEWCRSNMVPPLGLRKYKDLVMTRLDLDWKDKQCVINGEKKTRKGFKSKSARKSASGFKLADP